MGHCCQEKKSQENGVPLTSDEILLAGRFLHSHEAKARDDAIWHQGCSKNLLATGG